LRFLGKGRNIQGLTLFRFVPDKCARMIKLLVSSVLAVAAVAEKAPNHIVT
jgi:hypothetical protein